MGELVGLTLLTILTIAIVIVMNTVRSRLMALVGQGIIYDMRRDLLDHLQELPFSFYDSRPHGKILTRVIQYVNNVSDMLSNGVVNFILEIFNLIFIAIFMFFVDVQLSLVVVAGIPIFVVVILLIKPAQRRVWQQVSNKGSNMNAYLQESLDGAKITQLFTREQQNAGIFDRLNMDYYRLWNKAQRISNCVWVTVDNVSTWVVGALYIIGVLVMNPMASFGTIVAISNYAWRFWQPLLNLSNLYNTFINGVAYLERIFEMIDEPVEIKDAPDAYELPKVEGRVTFEDVTFAYEPPRNILEHVSFDVKPGESIALVGPTGAGKSTIVNLISRFYDLSGGRILIDGHDISKVTLHSLRSQMGIMLQDSFIFSGTILDNIRYARQDATDEEVRRACKTVCADEFISEMEKGYLTEVNERGSRLSQGQRQLVSFARTLLADPKILILDEATSSIDAKTERMVQTALNELLKGKRSAFLRGIRCINLCAAFCQKGDWTAAKEALLEISWRRLRGLQRALYLANLAYVCFYLKEDREALETMRHNRAGLQKYRAQLGALADVLAIFEAAANGEKKAAARLLAEARQDYQGEEACQDFDELERRLGAAQTKEQ